MYAKRLVFIFLRCTILLLIKNTFPLEGQDHATAEGDVTINDSLYKFKVTSAAGGDNNR